MCCGKQKQNIKPVQKQTTRDSCLECVEKHISGAMRKMSKISYKVINRNMKPSDINEVERELGASAIKINELRDGYEYRLEIIGHLNEAEEESQEWTELHNAIRDARKLFQSSEIRPDFRKLAEMINNVRNIAPDDKLISKPDNIIASSTSVDINGLNITVG